MNSPTRSLALTASVLTALVMFGAFAFVIWSWEFAPGAAAQGVNVEITELDCNSDPEMLTVENKGATPVDMTGWNLQSDPTTSESLPLQQFGSLAAGASLSVQSGPSAQGLVWSNTEKFRNNDPNDFAQLASDEGFVLVKVNCTATAQQTAAPTAAPTVAATAPTPAATALAAAAAPVGGGPPEVGATVPPGLLIAVGSGLLSAGLGMFALPFSGRRRRNAAAAKIDGQEPPPAEVRLLPAGNAPQRTTRAGEPGGASGIRSPYIFLAMIGLLLVATLLFLLQFGEQKRE